MNKVLVLTERKDYEGVVKGLYGENGFQVKTFTSADRIRITEDDHFIVVYPKRKSPSLSGVIRKAKKQVSGLKVICVALKETSPFLKQFNPKEVDAYLTEKTTLGEIQETIRRLMFPEKYQGQSSQTLNSSDQI